MVSKKKRVVSQSRQEDEPSSKKPRAIDNPGTSGVGSHSQDHGNQKQPKSPRKRDKHVTIKEEVEEEVPSNSESEQSEEDIVEDQKLVLKKTKKPQAADTVIDWSESDLMELISRMENAIPQKDVLRFESRAKKLPWKEVCFGDHTPEQCQAVWLAVQPRLRGYRTLKEVLDDAKEWVSKPWTNFYRSSKGNRHPDLPKRPLSTYMLFYLEKKDRVAKENPHLEMTGVSKAIAEMYKNLSEKKKAKYTQMAAQERRIYEEKMEQFYHDHPEQIPKPGSSKEAKSSYVVNSGPQKPTAPFKLFCAEKIRKHKDDPGFNRGAFVLKCKTQWRVMPDTKKVEWINRCLEEENKYQDEMRTYATENPQCAQATFKSFLTKEERSLLEKVAGKPEKPPNSGYSLFSRLMLVSPDIKKIAPKERMLEISHLWKEMNEQDQNKYKGQVTHMLEQYKLEYATYLESLPEDKRLEELSKNRPKRKEKVQKKDVATKIKVEPKTPDSPRSASQEVTLYKGEPEQPPVNVYQLFMQNFLKSAKSIPSNQREKEANKEWQLLPEDDKAKLRKQLSELKQHYIKEFEKFLKRLSQDELKEYSLLKAGEKKKTTVSFSDNSDSDDEDAANSDVNLDSDSDSDSDNESNSDSNSSDSSDNQNGSSFSDDH